MLEAGLLQPPPPTPHKKKRKKKGAVLQIMKTKVGATRGDWNLPLSLTSSTSNKDKE